MNKTNVLNRLKASGIVAVMRNMKPDRVVEIVQALKAGGLTAVEITVESEGGLEAIKVVKDHFGGDILLGAGTILDGTTAGLAIDAGADFIVTPIVSEEAIAIANERECVIATGAMTPTEILAAYNMGAEVVKVFPAGSLGPDYLKNVKGPLGHIPLMPTGGINLTNIASYINSGAVCVGVGGALYQYESKEEITNAAKQFMDVWNTARG